MCKHAWASDTNKPGMWFDRILIGCGHNDAMHWYSKTGPVGAAHCCSTPVNMAILNGQRQHYPKVVATAMSTGKGKSTPLNMFEGQTEEEIAKLSHPASLGGRYLADCSRGCRFVVDLGRAFKLNQLVILNGCVSCDNKQHTLPPHTIEVAADVDSILDSTNVDLSDDALAAKMNSDQGWINIADVQRNQGWLGTYARYAHDISPARAVRFIRFRFQPTGSAYDNYIRIYELFAYGEHSATATTTTTITNTIPATTAETELACNKFGFLFGGKNAGEDAPVTQAVGWLKQTGEYNLWTETTPAVPTTGAKYGRCASRLRDCTCYWCTDLCDEACSTCATCSCCGGVNGSTNHVHVYGRAPSSDRGGCERIIGAIRDRVGQTTPEDVNMAGGVEGFKSNLHYDAEKNNGVNVQLSSDVGFWWGSPRPDEPTGKLDENGQAILTWSCKGTDYVYIKPPMGALSMTVTYSGWYNTPENGVGQLIVQPVGDDSDGATMIHLRDAHSQAEDGQSLAVRNKQVFKYRKEDVVDRVCNEEAFRYFI